MTLGSVRRYLEEEMGHEKNTLDPFKKFIKEEIDKVGKFLTLAPRKKREIKEKFTDSPVSMLLLIYIFHPLFYPQGIDF